jgi:hypothetical protein
VEENPLITEARKLTSQGFSIIPLKDKIAIIKYKHRRKAQATIREIDLWFSNVNGKAPKANGIAIAINDTEFGIDTDGEECEYLFLNRIISKLSSNLQNKICKTMHTKTPRGHHRIFRYMHEEVTSGIKEKTYLKLSGEHNEIALKGKDHYLVERGPGYEIINGVENIVTLTKIEVEELLDALASFGTEHGALTTIVNKLKPYYTQPNRNEIIFALSGYLHKGKTPEHVIIEIAQRLVDVTGFADENPKKIFQTIRDTCAKDANSDQVSGYKRLYEALKLALSPDSKTDDVSNTILEVEYTLKGAGLFTIPKREHQQAQQELIDKNNGTIGTNVDDDNDELKGINDNILAQLNSHVYAVVSSNPPVLYIAHEHQKCIRKAIIKFSKEERESKDAKGQQQKTVTQRQTLLLKQKLVYATPVKVVINNNPLTDSRTCTITFVSKRDKKLYTIGPATIAEVIETLDKKGKILNKKEATDALTAVVERYDELGLAEIRDGITQPGYYWIDGQIRGYGINQRLDIDPQNNEQDRKAVLECIGALEGFQLRNKKKVAFPTVLKWGILAPFSFITKTQTPGVEDWLPWLYLYDTTDTGKTTLIINAVLAIWGKHDKQQNEIHIRGPGSVDTPSKFGITISQTTYPILVDEVGALLNDDSRRDNILLDMVKYSVQGKHARTRFNENILALSPLAFTSNDPPPQDSAYRRRFVAVQYYENEKWTEAEKEEFKRWLANDDIRDKLKTLGDFVARYIIEHPEIILRYSSYSWNECATAILKELYRSVGKEPAEWIDLIAEQTIVKEVSEEKQLEFRGFLQQTILEAYRRESFINPDPSTIDSNGRRIFDMHVTFEQKINHSLDNKSVPFLHICKRNFGQETQVAITSNIRSELKRYDKSASAMTMNALASKIPGFEYNLRNVNGQRIRVVCGPKSKFVSFLDCEVTEM